MGKSYAFRGEREHKALKLSQFTFGFVNRCEYVKYTEHGSKNRSGSYKDKADNKVVRHFSDPSLGEHCYVYLVKKYFEKVPPQVKESELSEFYWKPKE